MKNIIIDIIIGIIMGILFIFIIISTNNLYKHKYEILKKDLIEEIVYENNKRQINIAIDLYQDYQFANYCEKKAIKRIVNMYFQNTNTEILKEPFKSFIEKCIQEEKLNKTK